MILLIIILLLLAIYSFLVLYYGNAWASIPVFTPSQTPSQVRISVIIPARNEEAHIGALLQALQEQTYPAPLFEVIVVDDQSTDHTAAIVKQFPAVRLLHLQDDAINSYKKKAIATGVAAATGQLIVTTDADCIPPAEWLQTIAAFKETTGAVFIVAPVTIRCNSSVLQLFQSMDFMVLQAITGAGIEKKKLSMCNGANLAYERDAFYAVNGFEGIDAIASGDDMLLLHKIWKRYPGRVHYLKSEAATVATEPMYTFRSFLHQRIRWASKAAKYDDKRIFAVLLLVYLFNAGFPALLVAGFCNPYYWIALAGLWIAKTLAEFPLFISAARFFHKEWAIRLFFFFQPLHITYTLVSGLLGQVKQYEWKGRRVK